jgi:hypothetical protein
MSLSHPQSDMTGRQFPPGMVSSTCRVRHSSATSVKCTAFRFAYLSIYVRSLNVIISYSNILNIYVRRYLYKPVVDSNIVAC